MAKLKTYRVSRRVNIWVDVEIRAKDFDDAVAQAKQLEVGDFIEAAADGLIDYDWNGKFAVAEA